MLGGGSLASVDRIDWAPASGAAAARQRGARPARRGACGEPPSRDPGALQLLVSLILRMVHRQTVVPIFPSRNDTRLRNQGRNHVAELSDRVLEVPPRQLRQQVGRRVTPLSLHTPPVRSVPINNNWAA